VSIFSNKLNAIASNTNSYLKSFFLKQKSNSYLLQPMKYGVFSGGKRFRSAIVVNTGRIFNIDYKKLIIIGSAIECIHSYSLIHDDLPSMDNDELRRGKLSVHKKFNEFTAILAGNSLLTLAFEILSGKDLQLSQNYKNELIKTLSMCAGHSGLAGGQYSDLTFENKSILKKNIINMQNKKTGELFGFCCESIAIIQGIKSIKRKKLKEIGINIGLLFQIVDDLIDYKGDSMIVGKPTRSDEKKGKATLVNLLGYEETINFAKNLKKKIDQQIKKYGTKANDLLDSVEFILERKFWMSKTNLLDKINYPADLRKLRKDELKQLAKELREELIDVVSTTGGHLGAGLGVVELTIALHYVFDTPKDKLVWDVGHQAYPHKIITGRRDNIRTLRKGGGLSGFTKRSESEYDTFGAAHSSTSISSTLGIAVAKSLSNNSNHAIAVIGDGAMSAGMAYEAMNNAGAMKSKLIVILNDNDMSIAPPVGAMSSYLARLLSGRTYFGFRETV